MHPPPALATEDLDLCLQETPTLPPLNQNPQRKWYGVLGAEPEWGTPLPGAPPSPAHLLPLL